MKRLPLMAVALVMLGSSVGATPMDPNPDRIGFYIDQGGTCNGLDVAAQFTVVEFYLLATNPSRPSMSGWEATVLINPTNFATGVILDPGPGAINLLTPPYFSVELFPTRTGNPVLLLTFSTFYLGGTVLFGVGACVPSSFEGLTPGYRDGTDPFDWVALEPSGFAPWTLPAWGGGAAPISAPANSVVTGNIGITGCAEAVEATSWGKLKALSR